MRRAGSARSARACGISIRRSTTRGSTAGFASRRTSVRRRGCRSSSVTSSTSKTRRRSSRSRAPDGKPVEVTDAEYTARFEDIEIRALTQFLLASSQPFEYLDPAGRRHRSRPRPSAASGCSSRAAAWPATRTRISPASHSTQGPDLSRVAAKFNTGKGQRWLYSWLRQPNRYHSRTVMPNVFLEPIAEVDAAGKPTGKVTDSAADVAAFLLCVPADWQPTDAPAGPELDRRRRAGARRSHGGLAQRVVPEAAGRDLRAGRHSRSPRRHGEGRRARPACSRT